MTEATMALMEYLRKHDLVEGDFLRDAVQLMMQQLIELEVSEQVGAGRKSVTARLRFRLPDGTLRHEDVDPQVKRVVELATSELGATLRS